MTGPPVSVLHVVDSLEIGGAERALLLLVTHLDPARFRCRVFPLRPSGPFLVDLEKQGLLLSLAPHAGLAGRLRGLWDHLAQERPTIVHTHLNRSDLLVGPLARAARVPVVLSYKASILRQHRLRQPVYDWLTTISSWSNDAVVVLSEALRTYLLAHRIVPNEKIRVVRYGIELESDTASQTPRESLDLSTGPVVLLAARLEPRKDHVTFLEAARLVLAEKPSTQFLLAGDGEPSYRARLEQLAEPLGRAVRFLGNRSDIPGLIGLSDLVVLASRTEGLGLVLLEAMVHRRPVVATGVGGVPEIVVNGETGLLVEPGSPDALARAILDLLDTPDRSRRMGEAGRRRAEEQFSVQRMVRDMAGVYEEMLARRTPASLSV